MKELVDIESIGFDGKRAVVNYSGLGNYSRLVIELVAGMLPDARLRLYTPKIKPNPQLEPLLSNPNLELVLPDTRMGRMFGSLWRSSWMSSQLRRDGLSFYHGVSNQLPAGIDRTGIPSVVTIHDLIFRRHPEFYHKADAIIYDRQIHRSAEQADRIIAISERTRDDIIDLYGISPSKIDLVYQGCDSSFYRPVTQEAVADMKRRYGITGRYIVGVGTIEARKNQMLALKALRFLPDDVTLVLVGRPTDYTKAIQREAAALGLDRRLKLIHGAPFRDFPAFYAGAELSSYPSFYEGFGIPVIESIAAGTPVIAATGSCLEEAGGPGGVYVSPLDERLFAEYAEAIMADGDLRERMVREGRAYISRFSAAEFSKGLREVYSKVLANK